MTTEGEDRLSEEEVVDPWAKWIPRLTVLGVLAGILLFSSLVFRGCCVTFVDSYEVGYSYDLRSGQLSHLDRTGYILHSPLVDIHTVDLRPMQVCINANARVLNCKLVQFNPAGLDLFLSWHGRANYEATALNPNEATALNPILMSYAYDGSGKNYPFLTVIRELKPEEAVAPAVSAR
jgi:hypothetical protein